MAGSIKIAIQVLGARQITRALDRATPEVRARVAEAIRVTATEVAADARSRVPVRTGELRNTIRAEPGDRSPLVWFVKAGYGSLKRRRRAGKSTAKRRKPQVRAIGPIEPGIYAMVVEFGSQSGRARQPARPYLFPALESARDRHVARVRRALFDATQAVERAK